MKLENGYSDLKVSEEALGNIQSLLDSRFEDDDTDNVKLILNLIEDDSIKEKGDSFGWEVVKGFSLVMKYPHPDKESDDAEYAYLRGGREIGNEHLISSLLEQTEVLIEKRDAQHTCSHRYKATVDVFGSVFGDGRGVCVHCELSSSKALPVDKNQRPIVSASLSKVKEFVAQQDWPAGTNLQAGESGLVLSKQGNYETAFFEAFPKVGEHGTFIRGESDDVIAAEKVCYEKYQRMVACDHHEFSRAVNGTHRDDGCGQCTKCGLFSSSALPPLTLCSVCDSPAKRNYKDGYICDDDYFGLSVEDMLSGRKEYSYRDQSEKEKQLSSLSAGFVFVVKCEYFKQYGKDSYKEYGSFVSAIASRVLMLVNQSVFDIHPFRTKEGEVVPNIHNPVYQEIVIHLLKRLSVLSDEEHEGFELEWLGTLCEEINKKQGSEKNVNDDDIHNW